MFLNCESLITLPDISKWNTSNVKNISGMFLFCNSLISLPDISKWDTNEVKHKEDMFSGCNSLISLPNISKWSLSVKDMKTMFDDCINCINLRSKAF